jgi:hypothetical protein
LLTEFRLEVGKLRKQDVKERKEHKKEDEVEN